jgi:predicted lipid-binding transport protein (Tim44 family)
MAGPGAAAAATVTRAPVPPQPWPPKQGRHTATAEIGPEMGGSFQFLDIILFALIAAFIALRLRGALGRRPDRDEGTQERPGGRPPADAARDNVIALPDSSRRAEDPGFPSDVAAAFADIRQADPSFSWDSFRTGAVAAHAMVVAAYAEGDVETLRALLSDEVYAEFVAAIGGREERGESLTTTLVSDVTAEPVGARLSGTVAEVTVRYVGDVVNVTRDRDGVAISGDPGEPQQLTDVWTFARDTTSPDPNWQLVETRTSD